MSLDRRLNEGFRQVAAGADPRVDAGALRTVVRRAEAVRRRRIVGLAATAGAATLLVLALFPARALLSREATPTAPRPIPTASPTPKLTGPHVSKVYGYSMSFPAGWRVIPATQPWPYGQDIAGAGRRDRYQSPGAAVVFVSSQQLPRGMTDQQWLTQFLPKSGEVAEPQCFQPPARWDPVTVDGHPGGIHGGDFACGFTEAVVIADHRAYVFTAQPNPAHWTGEIFDMGVLTPMLASVHLFAPTSQ
jgi:hypothetical protein